MTNNRLREVWHTRQQPDRIRPGIVIHTSDGRCADHGTDQDAAIAYETLGFKLFRSEKLSSSIRALKIVELALDAYLSPADDSSLHDSRVFLRIFSVTRDRFTRAIQLGFAPIGFKITVETEDRFARRPVFSSSPEESICKASGRLEHSATRCQPVDTNESTKRLISSILLRSRASSSHSTWH